MTCLCSIYNCVECSTLILLCQCSFFGNFGNLIWCVCLTVCKFPAIIILQQHRVRGTRSERIKIMRHATHHHMLVYLNLKSTVPHGCFIVHPGVLVKSSHYDPYEYTGLSLPEYDSHPGLKPLPSPWITVGHPVNSGSNRGRTVSTLAVIWCDFLE